MIAHTFIHTLGWLDEIMAASTSSPRPSLRGICKSQPASKYGDLIQPDLIGKDLRKALVRIYEERRPKRKREYKPAEKRTSKVETKKTKGKGDSRVKTDAAKKTGAKQKKPSVVEKNKNQVSVAEPPSFAAPLHHQEGERAEKSDQEHAEPAAEQCWLDDWEI
jgi:hypothetical protein